MQPMFDNEDLGLTLTAIAYYLYAEAGRPYGDSFDAFESWLAGRVMEPFEAIAQTWKPEEGADEQ